MNCVIDFCASNASAGAANANAMVKHTKRARFLVLERSASEADPGSLTPGNMPHSWGGRETLSQFGYAERRGRVRAFGLRRYLRCLAALLWAAELFESLREVTTTRGACRAARATDSRSRFEDYDTQARAGVHSSEQILEAFEDGGVYNV
jgi:hypothetical protein